MATRSCPWVEHEARAQWVRPQGGLALEHEKPEVQNSKSLDTMSSFRRLITCFEKQGDRFVSEQTLPTHVTLGELQRIFRVEADDPMYGCFPIGTAEALALSQLGVECDVSTFDCFVEVESDC